MSRGFSGPPNPYLVHREPLRSDELDRTVIRGMGGFGFGTEEEIERKLVEILESDVYHRAVQCWEGKRDINNGRNGVVSGKDWDPPSDTSLGYKSVTTDTTASASKKSNHFPGFEFYRRKLFLFASSHLSPNSLPHPREPVDPMYGFHPLISIYFLAREGMERERVYGPGHFASSQLLLMTNPAVKNNTDVRTEGNSMRPAGSTGQSVVPPITAAATEPTTITRANYGISVQLPTADPTPGSSILVDPDVPACRRLTSLAFSPHEVVSLIEETFTSKDEVEMIRDLRGHDAQTFIDVVHEVCLHTPSFPGRSLIASSLAPLLSNLCLVPIRL